MLRSGGPVREGRNGGDLAGQKAHEALHIDGFPEYGYALQMQRKNLRRVVAGSKYDRYALGDKQLCRGKAHFTVEIDVQDGGADVAIGKCNGLMQARRYRDDLGAGPFQL